MSKFRPVHWSYRKQKEHVAELMNYLTDKWRNAVVLRTMHDPSNYTLVIDTYAGSYTNVLFPEIERLSEGWTKYNATMSTLIRGDPEGYVIWESFRTSPEWRNARPQRVPPETYVRIDIELIQPTKEKNNGNNG